MLLELAVGDAYGAGFEYVSADLIQQHNDLSRYFHHPRHRRILPGMYTDDTQMSLAIAEAILSGEAWTPLMLANKFVECFKRDQRTGYAGGFYEFLQRIESGEQFLAEIRPTSDKSGAAMRAGPIGVYSDLAEVKERCKLQAAITHNTPDGIHAAQVASLMTHYFIYGIGPKADLGRWLESLVPGQWSEPWAGKVKSKGWMSVRAAITAVQRNDSLSDLLRDCIEFTGDVDTVATVALAAASCSEEYTQNLPDHLLQSLENGAYGREYIEKLDGQLMEITQPDE
ncbi:MAG: ADP-ribosylglycohydrolase family protein [Anaerolineae bacterium]|nr:ADP-ribosylglycohydrolase family protein [Anaerolineae bacterium]